MAYETRKYVIADPRNFEGNPYEAAAKAMAQIEALIEQIQNLLPTTRIIVRNAELERQMISGEPNPTAWERGPQGRKLDYLASELSAAQAAAHSLKAAAGFDPRGV